MRRTSGTRLNSLLRTTPAVASLGELGPSCCYTRINTTYTFSRDLGRRAIRGRVHTVHSSFSAALAVRAAAAASTRPNHGRRVPSPRVRPSGWPLLPFFLLPSPLSEYPGAQKKKKKKERVTLPRCLTWYEQELYVVLVFLLNIEPIRRARCICEALN